MMLPLIILILNHATYAKSVSTEFTIQGGGKIDSGKLEMDIHVEAVNITASVNATTSPPTTFPPTTFAPTTIPPITAPNVTSPTIPPSVSGLPETPAPGLGTTLKPTPTTSGSNVTSAPSTTQAGATTTPSPTTAAGANSTTSPPVLNNTTTPPTEAVNVTIPTPAPEYAGMVKLENSHIFSDLDRTALELHNYYRSIHEAPVLSLDFNLQKDAQDYANKVSKSRLLRPEQDFVLSSRNEGENLGFRCSVTRPDPARALRQIMKRWYDEGCKYNFQTPPTDKYSYRHFTQLTWNGSKRLGVGIAYGKVNNLQCLYFVARYRPRGNMGPPLSYVNNVRKGVFDSSFCKPIANQLSKQEVILKN